MAQGLLKSNNSRDGVAAALLWNVSELENGIYQVQEEWEQQHSIFNEMQASLEEAGLRRLNGPNMLNQHWWTNNTGVGHNVIYGKDSRISGTSVPYLSSYNDPTKYELQAAPTAAELAEACSYYTWTDDQDVVHYDLYKDEDDIIASVAELAAADQITELDGAVYDKAIQFNITENSAYGNAEWLMYYEPNHTRVYTEGDTNVRNYGQLEDMQPGRKYTLSFWARVISGAGANARFGFGNSYSNAPYGNTDDGRMGISDWIEIKGSAWKRYSWTFEFNPQGDWYTETSAEVDGVTKVTRTYNWFKKVCFGFGRKYTAVIQVCGFRMTEGNLWITDTYDDLTHDLNEIKDRVDSADSALMENLAEAEEETATANHAIGDPFTMGRKLYKATAAIAAGETIAVGTNCAVATVEELFAPKNNPSFTGNVSGSKGASFGYDCEISEYASFAAGEACKARSYNSSAIGLGCESNAQAAAAFGGRTVANGSYSMVFGKDNVPDDLDNWDEWVSGQVYEVGAKVKISTLTPALQSAGVMTGAYVCKRRYGGTGTNWSNYWDTRYGMNYLEIVGNGTYEQKSNARTLDWEGNESLAGGLTLGKGTADEVTITAAQLKQLLDLLS